MKKGSRPTGCLYSGAEGAFGDSKFFDGVELGRHGLEGAAAMDEVLVEGDALGAGFAGFVEEFDAVVAQAGMK